MNVKLIFKFLKLYKEHKIQINNNHLIYNILIKKQMLNKLHLL